MEKIKETAQVTKNSSESAKENVKKIGNPYDVAISKIEIFSCSNLATPFYHLSDGRVVGGIRLGSLCDKYTKQDGSVDWDAVLYDCQNIRTLVGSFSIYKLDGSDWEYQYALKNKQLVHTFNFETPLTALLQDVKVFENGEWLDKYSLVSSPYFYARDYENGKLTFHISQYAFFQIADGAPLALAEKIYLTMIDAILNGKDINNALENMNRKA